MFESYILDQIAEQSSGSSSGSYPGGRWFDSTLCNQICGRDATGQTSLSSSQGKRSEVTQLIQGFKSSRPRQMRYSPSWYGICPPSRNKVGSRPTYRSKHNPVVSSKTSCKQSLLSCGKERRNNVQVKMYVRIVPGVPNRHIAQRQSRRLISAQLQVQILLCPPNISGLVQKQHASKNFIHKKPLKVTAQKRQQVQFLPTGL